MEYNENTMSTYSKRNWCYQSIIGWLGLHALYLKWQSNPQCRLERANLYPPKNNLGWHNFPSYFIYECSKFILQTNKDEERGINRTSSLIRQSCQRHGQPKSPVFLWWQYLGKVRLPPPMLQTILGGNETIIPNL